MKTVTRVSFKLNKVINLGKAPLNKLDNKKLVYKIECLNCPKNYVDQTKRLLNTRLQEHKNNINLNNKYHNVISNHITIMNFTGPTSIFFIKKENGKNVPLQK